MKLRVKTRSNVDLSTLRDRASAISKGVAHAALKGIADRVAAEVVKKIPSAGGWFDIYRKSITVKEEGNGWVVCGLCDVALPDYPYETSLLTVVGDDPLAMIIANYNPWPIDLIPVVTGGYNATAVVKSSTEEEVAARREALAVILDNIHEELLDKGASLNDADIVEFSGGQYPDLRFLANRLEKGFNGYPHIPHWSPAISKALKNGNEWGASAGQDALRKAVRGE